jgi:glycosyltransferase involved in cell wall biosynthesis
MSQPNLPTSKVQKPRVAMVQDGARLHYAVPAALQELGLLQVMYTEWYSRPGAMLTRLTRFASLVAGSSARRMLERYSPRLGDAHIIISPWLQIREMLARRKFPSSEAYFAWASRKVGQWVARKGFGNANVLMGFVRNIDPALCELAHARGLKVVVDQMIAPAAIEAIEAQRQLKNWPTWAIESEKVDSALVDSIERQTWKTADLITCASDYVKEGLLSLGISEQLVQVIPYPVDTTLRPADRSERKGPLTVGFVGAINLRKGAPYFLEVARRLGKQMRFVMVGPVKVSEQAVAELRDSVQLTGQVARSEIGRWLGEFDVFLFPSTCEGSAGAVSEAMAAGLPCVVSPNSGSVVRDGIDGYVVKYDDIDLMCQRLSQLADGRDLRLQMGDSARNRIESFGIMAYSQRLSDLLRMALSAS